MVKLPYGETKKTVTIPDTITSSILSFQGHTGPLHVRRFFLEKLINPTVGRSLISLLKEKKPSKIVIVVNDTTRSTPTITILKPLLDYLAELNIQRNCISIVVATGTHRLTTEPEKQKLFGKEIVQHYRIVSHDCCANDLQYVGHLNPLTPLFINKEVVQADFRITIGEILYHYFAGFSGGRKSIFPGVSNKDAILTNHSKMVSKQSFLGNLCHNPVHIDMMKSLHLCPVDFSINVICNEEKEIIKLFTGDAVKSWEQGVLEFRNLFSVPISNRSDMAIVSAGGFPKDINLYQAHKALELTAGVVKPGGKILLVAECKEKYGHDVFQHFASKNMTSTEIKDSLQEKFIFGLHKLYFLSKLKEHYQLYLYSTFSRDETESVHMKKVDTIEEIFRQNPPSKSCYIIPQGGICYFNLQEEKKG